MALLIFAVKCFCFGQKLYFYEDQRLGLANALAYYGTEIIVFKEEEALGESSWSDFVSAFFLFLIPLDFLQVILHNSC
jgi:hypothetical protein